MNHLLKHHNYCGAKVDVDNDVKFAKCMFLLMQNA